MPLNQLFSDFPMLETDRLLLRAPQKADATGIFLLARDKDVARYTSWSPHQSLAESEQVIKFLRNSYKDHRSVDFIIEHKFSRKIIGMIGFMDILESQCRFEAGYWIGKPYWGKGYATEALKRIIRFGFEELAMERIQAVHFVENPASGRVMLKAGMSYEGTLHKYFFAKERLWDTCIYAILKEKYMDKMGKYYHNRGG